jgi:hypothetical protein
VIVFRLLACLAQESNLETRLPMSVPWRNRAAPKLAGSPGHCH